MRKDVCVTERPQHKSEIMQGTVASVSTNTTRQSEIWELIKMSGNTEQNIDS